MSKTYINIEGQTLDPSKLTLPASRENRDAWTRNGDVVEVDPVKVRQLKEAEVDAQEKEAFESVSLTKALADATVDLVFAAKNGQLDARSRNEVKQLLRQRVRFYLREDRSLPNA